MTTKQALLKAFKIIGKDPLAKKLGISYQSMDRWVMGNKMPATEFTGQTQYSRNIQALTIGQVQVVDLCGWVPITQTDDWDFAKQRPKA